MVTANFLLAGVGGQGTLLASDILADIGLRIGADVKKSEVHGMSQRGGAVTSHVRWGEHVASPLCEKGAVDYFVAQEMLEALRWIEFIRPGGTVLLSQQQIVPTSTVYGADQYPTDDHVISVVKRLDVVGGHPGEFLLVERHARGGAGGDVPQPLGLKVLQLITRHRFVFGIPDRHGVLRV